MCYYNDNGAQSNSGSQGGCSISQLSLGERRGTPWSGRQSITGPHKQPATLKLSPSDNSESPMNLTCKFLGGGRRSLWEPMHTHREHANSTQKGPSWDSHREPSYCEVMVSTTRRFCFFSYLKMLKIDIKTTCKWKQTAFCSKIFCDMDGLLHCSINQQPNQRKNKNYLRSLFLL